MKYTQEQIEAAVEKVVGDWDIETLMTFCIDETVYYYTGKNVSDSCSSTSLSSRRISLITCLSSSRRSNSSRLFMSIPFRFELLESQL